MNRSDGSKIPEPRLPRRADLSGDSVETIHAGRSIKANVLRLDLGEGAMVVKDFGAKRWWVRLIGRLQIAVEQRAYRRLQGLEGIPRYYGRIDAYALAIEHIDGVPLGFQADCATDGTTRFARLREIVTQIHARGVVHWDLRARRNVLLQSNGEMYVVDFASAVYLRPGGLLHRLLFRKMQSPDHSSLLKWKQILQAGELTDDETRRVERHRRWRRLWIFNRKGGGRE